MKIQINSLAALERLIGGDTNVELEIRQNIVQEFTKRYLKSLIDDGAVAKCAQEVKQYGAEIGKEVQRLASEEFGTFKKDYFGNTVSVTLKPELAKEVAERARAANSVLIGELITKAVGELAVQEYIKQEITRQLQYKIDDTTRQVRAKLLENLAK